MGFGNIFRRDDGVALRVVNALREHLNRPPMDWEEDGFDDLGHSVDTVLLHQLVPEVAETVSQYDQVIFVDAHVSQIEDPVRVEAIDACYRESTVPHQLHPCSILAMANELYGCSTEGLLVSVRGHDFDFGDQLSAQTARLVPQAADCILARIPGTSQHEDDER
jgi:hydrogenase maturation protease